MRRTRYLLRWLSGLVVVYTITGFFLVPVLVKKLLVQQARDKLHREATVARVRCNPYTLSLTVDGLNIRERAAADRFAGWERLYLNLQLSSLFHRAVVLRQVSLSNAFLHVAIQPDRTLNFSDLIPPPSTNPPAPPPTIRIGQLQITGAHVLADDRSRREPLTSTIGPVNLEVRNFSTHPDNKNLYAFTATTETGEYLAWRGSFHLQPLRSTGDFRIERIALPKYAPYLDLFPNLHLRDGRLSLSGTYEINLTTNIPVATLSNTTLVLGSLRLAERTATNDATPVIAGTAEPGSGVSVAVAGATYATTAGSDGAWSVDLGTATPTAGTLALDRFADSSSLVCDLYWSHLTASAGSKERAPWMELC